MIKFNNITQNIPYTLFQDFYSNALRQGQKNIEAIAISSYNPAKKEVDSRFVNLKFIQNDEFIFFTNYNSPKSIAFNANSQISALIYWHTINVQIRIKATIKKTTVEFNKEYFKNRAKSKNILAISSNQSNIISSYNKVLSKYEDVKNSSNLEECPKYWGGYSFTPYEIEFWEGHQNRLNNRNLYKKDEKTWSRFTLEP
jgi:pyridoxamine 5'-phosphate oxidase